MQKNLDESRYLNSSTAGKHWKVFVMKTQAKNIQVVAVEGVKEDTAFTYTLYMGNRHVIPMDDKRLTAKVTATGQDRMIAFLRENNLLAD